jgi:hypothetical protein
VTIGEGIKRNSEGAAGANTGCAVTKLGQGEYRTGLSGCDARYDVS